LVVLHDIDALLGRVWTAIQKSPLAPETALVIVSDHGFNSDERVISQGFNLVRLLASANGGGHHVITKRRLLMDYALKGINPFVPPITTTSSQSYYLRGQSTDYPTALLDFDGNERAGLHLRYSDLNVLHILLQQLQTDPLPHLRQAATQAFFSVIDRHRSDWQADLDEFSAEVSALNRAAEKQRELCASQPKKFSPPEIEMGRDDHAQRNCIASLQWKEFAERYAEYLATMRKLLALRRDDFAPAQLKIDELIPKHAMGQRNTIHDLQNYVVGLARNGLVMNSDGSLDFERSFTRLNYLDLIHGQTVRNNVQNGISDQPVDFIATRIPRDLIASSLSDDLAPDDDAVWLYGGAGSQALILPRSEEAGQLSLRYLPIANLTQDAHGVVHFQRAEWKAGLPLRILEDPRFDVPLAARLNWLSEWHTELEWLRVLHKTQYSSGLIGLH
jgi:Type I phosphodiesterase / nucleotide pyrophosphatase